MKKTVLVVKGISLCGNLTSGSWLSVSYWKSEYLAGTNLVSCPSAKLLVGQHYLCSSWDNLTVRSVQFKRRFYDTWFTSHMKHLKQYQTLAAVSHNRSWCSPWNRFGHNFSCFITRRALVTDQECLCPTILSLVGVLSCLVPPRQDACCKMLVAAGAFDAICCSGMDTLCTREYITCAPAQPVRI